MQGLILHQEHLYLVWKFHFNQKIKRYEKEL
jgi:hypothetical protein